MSFCRAAGAAGRSLRAASQLERAALNLARPSITSRQPFSTSSRLLKKRKQEDNHSSAAKSKNNKSAPVTASEATAEASGDPLDFSSVTEAYTALDSHFKSQVQTVVHGGRFNPAQLGALPVKMTIKPEDGGDGTTPHTFPLRELAQVVPRSGRTISLLVNDKSYIKPIMSAVQGSADFNQQPQRSEDNELELLLRVELERREELVRRIKEATQGWRERVRQARSKHEKLLKDGKKKGTVLPDVLRMADKELQKLQDKKMKEIDGEEASAIKQLERN